MTWIVHEGLLFDRWVAREVVGETDKFFVLQAYRPDGTCDGMEPRRKKKASIGRSAFFEDGDLACYVASQMTKDLLEEGEKYNRRKREIIDAHLSSAAPK